MTGAQQHASRHAAFYKGPMKGHTLASISPPTRAHNDAQLRVGLAVAQRNLAARGVGRSVVVIGSRSSRLQPQHWLQQHLGN